MEKIIFKHPVRGKVELGFVKNFVGSSAGHNPLKVVDVETVAIGNKYFTTLKYELTPEHMEHPLQAELLKQHFDLDVKDVKYQKSIENICRNYKNFKDCPENATVYKISSAVLIAIIIALIYLFVLKK